MISCLGTLLLIGGLQAHGAIFSDTELVFTVVLVDNGPSQAFYVSLNSMSSPREALKPSSGLPLQR
jgi:hypothetical protein